MRGTQQVIPRLLRENQNFRRFFIGQSVSLLGDQVAAIALPLTAVLALHAGAAEMGVLTTAYLIPNLLFSLHVGVWVDRHGKRRQTMLVADFARLSGSGGTSRLAVEAGPCIRSTAGGECAAGSTRGGLR